MSELLTQLDSGNCEIERQFPMDRYITLKVGGNAEALISPYSVSEFINVLNHVNNSGINFIVLGAGSNTILSESGIDGMVISTKKLRNFKIIDKYFKQIKLIPNSRIIYI